MQEFMQDSIKVCYGIAMPYHTNKPHDFNQRLIIFANAIKSVKELYETIIDLKIFRLMGHV